MSEWIGRTLSKVEIEKLLGRGGMADVYLGRHTTLNRPVAVKILQPHLVEDAGQLKRFTAEAQAVAGLRHPHIVQVFDFDVVDERPYIVMELLPGLSLKDYLLSVNAQGRILPIDTTARLISQIAGALDYAHQRGIVHRDVKPANVMLRQEDRSLDLSQPLPDDADAVLTDFGVAHIADSAGLTASGTIIGTPAYMSPEQVRGERIDSRSDIYSMGVMLYEMLSGRLPFEGETQASLLVKHMSEEPAPLPNAPAEIQTVLDRALVKTPDERYQTAGELANALLSAVGMPDLMIEDIGFLPPAETMEMDTPPSHEAHTMPGVTKEQDSATQISSQRKVSPLVIAGSVAGLIALVLIVLEVLGPFAGQSVGPATDVIDATATTEGDAVGDAETPQAAESVEPTEEETSPDETAIPTPDLTTPRGSVGFVDSTVAVELSELTPPPDGFVYEAWLVSSINEPLSLGTVDGTTITYTDPGGNNLLAAYDGLMISLEPVDDSDPAPSDQIVFEGMVDENFLADFRLMDTENRGQALKPAMLEHIPWQAEQFDSHLGFAVRDITGNSLSSGQGHSEHTINIAVGINSPDFGDWNNSGLAENPGDDVGLLTYLRILEAGLDDQHTDIKDQVESLIFTVEDAIDLARRIVVSDTLEEAQSLVLELEKLRTENMVSLLMQDIEGIPLQINVDILAVAP